MSPPLLNFLLIILVLLIAVVVAAAPSSSSWRRIMLHTGAAQQALNFVQVREPDGKLNKTLLGPYAAAGLLAPTAPCYQHVSQWNNPAPLRGGAAAKTTPPSAMCGGKAFGQEALWSIENEALRVCVFGNGSASSWSSTSSSSSSSSTSAFSVFNNSNNNNYASKSGGDSDFVFQLAQNGGGDRRRLKCGVEYDAFLEPNTQLYKTPFINVEPVALSDVLDLDLQLSIQLVDFGSTPSCCKKRKTTRENNKLSDTATPNTTKKIRRVGEQGDDDGASSSSSCCGVPLDYAYLTIGLPLSNPKHGQTIFYQIGLFDSRRAAHCPGTDACDPTQPPGWYFTKNPFGVNYNVARVLGNNNACIKGAGNTRYYKFGKDLLATLVASVREAGAKFGADGDLGDWQIGSLYVGSGLQGDARITTNVALGKFDALVKN